MTGSTAGVSGIEYFNHATMRKVLFFIVLLLIPATCVLSQVCLSTDNSPPDSSAGLEVKFTDRGFLIPRMTFDQRNAISIPDEGLIIFCTDCGLDSTGTICIWSNGAWSAVTPCITESPTAGTNTTTPCGQIVWTWNQVTGAAGYRWNNENSYDSAIDLGSLTSKTETGLQCGITYTRYVWAYSACGVSTPLTLSQSIACHVCGEVLTDCRDNKTYSTVLIGSQCWMAQNLDAGTQVNGTVTQTNNSVLEKYCHGNLATRCQIYGGLYQWGEFMNYSSSSNSNPSGRPGICPAGWHVPGDAEWTQLTNYLGGTPVAGGKMKETGTGHWNYPNTGATNSSGFTGLGAGLRNIDGTFLGLKTDGIFWTSTEVNSTDAYTRGLAYESAGISVYGYTKSMGFSARCVKD